MADIVTTTPQAQPEHPIEQPGQNGFLTRHRLALGAITLISVFMNFYRLGQNGFGTFYPAAVRSMMDAGAAAGTIRGDVQAEDVVVALVGIFSVCALPEQRDQAGRLMDLLMDGLRVAGS